MTHILAPRYAKSIVPRYAPCKAARYAIDGMKTVEEVRRERLLMLKAELGTLVALNEKIGLDKRDSTLSQILNSAPNSKTGKGKEMGSPMARKLETLCGKEVGWMDTDPDLTREIRVFRPDTAALALEIDALPKGEDRDRVMRLCLDVVEMAKPRPRDAGAQQSGGD